MSSQGHTRPYQGYPYVNPTVIDVPSISPDAAARWTNLPRRQIWRSGDGAGTSGMQLCSSQSQVRETAHRTVPSKTDPDETPVVYIELAERNGSDVAQNMEVQDTDESYVQDTIMYDPFENRRIAVGKRPDDADSSLSSVSDNSLSGQSNGSRPQGYPQSPERSHQDRLTQPNLTTNNTFGSKTSSGIPSFMCNETYIYSGDNDGFQSPISSGFPEPPPAYSETETPGRTPATIQQRPPEVVLTPPRTRVITTTMPDSSPMDTPNYGRKFLTCHHCGRRVHTLVIKEITLATHLIAFILFLFLMPLILLVYCTDWFKQKNHYCSNCNQLIGFVRPIVGSELVRA